LRGQPGVDPRHVLVFGVSRGSEAALLLGSHYPQLVNGVIAGERIRGPVLLACGLQDQEWPSCVYQDAISTRLAGHHFGYRVTDLRYSDAGHDVGGMDAIYSATAIAFTHGGSLAGNETALADSHAQLLSFLAAQ
jgi:pimeloyl-ACP methyl ester carboxylesterase